MTAQAIIAALAAYYGVSFQEMDEALQEAVSNFRRKP